MAFRHDYAVGTDDVGPVDAADIEELPALKDLAEVPPEDPDVAGAVLLGLEPAQALALCESSPFYQEICDSDGFKDRYRFKQHVNVLLQNLRGDRTTYSLFRTRVVGDVKELYERDTGLVRTEYMMIKLGSIHWVAASAAHELAVPTAQSLLGSVANLSSPTWGSRSFVRFDVVKYSSISNAPTLTHWFANGEKIRLSE